MSILECIEWYGCIVLCVLEVISAEMTRKYDTDDVGIGLKHNECYYYNESIVYDFVV